MDYWTDEELIGHMQEAIENVGYHWARLQEASTLPMMASSMTDVSNAIADLITWHPQFDLETGEIKYDDD